MKVSEIDELAKQMNVSDEELRLCKIISGAVDFYLKNGGDRGKAAALLTGVLYSVENNPGRLFKILSG